MKFRILLILALVAFFTSASDASAQWFGGWFAARAYYPQSCANGRCCSNGRCYSTRTTAVSAPAPQPKPIEPANEFAPVEAAPEPKPLENAPDVDAELAETIEEVDDAVDDEAEVYEEEFAPAEEPAPEPAPDQTAAPSPCERLRAVEEVPACQPVCSTAAPTCSAPSCCPLLAAANAVRAASGLAPLALDPNLEAGARSNANYNAQLNAGRYLPRLIHTGGPEIIAMNYNGFGGALDQWQNSPDHAAHLFGGYRYAGAAVVRGADGRFFSAMRFR